MCSPQNKEEQAKPSIRNKELKEVRMSGIVKLDAAKLLATVPEEHVFWCRDGHVFRDMSELGESLVSMSDETFAFHVNTEKNDFANWVRDIIGDEKLTRELTKSQNRTQAAQKVAERVDFLKAKLA